MEGVGGTKEKGEGIQMCKLALTEQSRDVEFSAGNAVSNIVVTMDVPVGTGLTMGSGGGHSVRSINV